MQIVIKSPKYTPLSLILEGFLFESSKVMSDILVMPEN